MGQVAVYFVCVGTLVLTLYLLRAYGLGDGARKAWLIVMILAPSWMAVKVPLIALDARSICALTILIWSLGQPYISRPGNGWYMADLFVILIIVIVTVSQILNKSVSPLAPLDPIRAYALPYLVGRMFIYSAEDIVKCLPVACVCLTAISVYAIFEGVSGINPMESVIGRPWKDAEEHSANGVVGGEELDSRRFGLKRAYVGQTHPIYFGLTLAMLLPWAIEAAVQSFNRRGPWWWRLVPLLMLAGVVTTGSRAAQICSLIVIYLMLFQAVPRLRPLMVLTVLFGGMGFYGMPDELIELLQDYVGENKDGDAFVKIDGELYEYSGTKHRDLLEIVYKDAKETTGWFGYGTLIRKVPRDSDMDERFVSIDNHYLVFLLQYGYVGVVAFFLLAGSVVWNLLPPIRGAVGPAARMTAGTLGGVGGCLVAMRGVWFSPDFSGVWLFGAGFSVALARWFRVARTPGVQSVG